MCAGKHFFCLNQQYSNNEIVYSVVSEDKFYYLTTSGLVEDSIWDTDKLKIEDFILPFGGDVADEGLWKPSSPELVYSRLQDNVSLLFADGQEPENHIVSLFIMATYVHELFDAFPHLWLCVRNYMNRTHLESLLHNLCFNAYPIPNGYNMNGNWRCFQATLELIKTFSPTLLFQIPSNSNEAKINYLISHPNQKDRAFIFNKLERMKTYCPKVVIHDRPLYQPLSLSTIPVTIYKEISFNENATNYALLRKDLLCSMRSLIPKLIISKDNISGSMSSYDFRFPFRVLSETLYRDNIMSRVDFEKLNGHLDELHKSNTQDYPHRLEEDVLFGVSLFLDENAYKYPDGYFPLDDIVTLLRHTPTLNDLTQNRLSRILNREKLCLERERRRADKTIGTHNQQTTVTIFRAFAKIDIIKLQKRIKNT
jgi:hypothetical protein